MSDKEKLSYTHIKCEKEKFHIKSDNILLVFSFGIKCPVGNRTFVDAFTYGLQPTP